MTWPEGPWQALRASEVVALVSVIVVHLEWLVAGRKLHEAGLGDWEIISLRYPALVRRGLDRPLGVLLGWRGMRAISVAMIIAALALLFGLAWPGPAHAVVLLGVVLGSMVFVLRNPYGMDGSDQMAQIVLISACVASLVGSEPLARIACWFVAAQLTLSYATAGIAKLVARTWRDGSAMPRIMRTETYGAAAAGEALRQRPRLALVAAWGVMLVEAGFVLVFVLPAPAAWTLMGLALLFHLGTALMMGLNSFFLAFLSAYPCLLWCLHDLRA